MKSLNRVCKRVSLLVVLVYAATILAACSKPETELLDSLDLNQILLDDMGVQLRPALHVRMLENMANRNPSQDTDLASRLYTGSGVEVSRKKSKGMFERAARRNDTKAQFCLAILYLNEETIAKDPVLAMKWLLIAAHGTGRYATLAERARSELAQVLSVSDLNTAEYQANQWLLLNYPSKEAFHE